MKTHIALFMSGKGGRKLVNWAKNQTGTIKEYLDVFSLVEAVKSKEIEQIVTPSLSYLGTAREIVGLLALCRRRKVPVVTLDGVDTGTEAGQLVARVLADVVTMDAKRIRHAQRYGMDEARRQGTTWGGRAKGSRNQATVEAEYPVRALYGAGETKVEIARTTGLSRPTIDRILRGLSRRTWAKRCPMPENGVAGLWVGDENMDEFNENTEEFDDP